MGVAITLTVSLTDTENLTSTLLENLTRERTSLTLPTSVLDQSGV